MYGRTDNIGSFGAQNPFLKQTQNTNDDFSTAAAAGASGAQQQQFNPFQGNTVGLANGNDDTQKRTICCA